MNPAAFPPGPLNRAALALALRFVPYSDNHGHFEVLWTAVMLVLIAAALAYSVYLVYVLEIVKLRRAKINPETGEFEALELDPEPPAPKPTAGSGKGH